MSRCRTKNDNEKETEIIETETEKTRPANTKNTNTRLQCPHFWREPWIHAPFSLNNPRKIRIPYTVGFPGGISTCSAPTVASFNRSRPLPLFLFFFPLYFLSLCFYIPLLLVLDSHLFSPLGLALRGFLFPQAFSARSCASRWRHPRSLRPPLGTSHQLFFFRRSSFSLAFLGFSLSQ